MYTDQYPLLLTYFSYGFTKKMLSLGNHPKYDSLLLKFKFWYTPSESKGVTYVMSEQFAMYSLGDTIRGNKRYVIPQLGNRSEEGDLVD